MGSSPHGPSDEPQSLVGAAVSLPAPSTGLGGPSSLFYPEEQDEAKLQWLQGFYDIGLMCAKKRPSFVDLDQA